MSLLSEFIAATDAANGAVKLLFLDDLGFRSHSKNKKHDTTSNDPFHFEHNWILSFINNSRVKLYLQEYVKDPIVEWLV